MYNGKRTAVIIAAAGRGRRVGGSVPKQYLKIGDEHVIIKTLRKFQEMDAIDHIFLVTNSDYMEFCEELVERFEITKVEDIIVGGKERQDSVFNAINVINTKKPGIKYLLVHDASRPFVSEEVILNVLKATEEKGAAVACVAMTNSVRKIGTQGDMSHSESVDRNDYFQVQTPQGFKKSILIDAYNKAYDDRYYGTDDASVVEWAGYEVEMVDGDYGNIKITTKEDLPMDNRVGIGLDVHRLVNGRRLVLGGVDIPYEKGLLGHSDADVLTHALMDALLGAAGLGDIGRHFPDTNDEYRGISSLILLSRVKESLDENFYKVGNVDITVIAEKPKIRPYLEEMTTNIAEVLDVEKSRINIKGTTTEKLGFVGRGDGIACEVVVSLYR